MTFSKKAKRGWERNTKKATLGFETKRHITTRGRKIPIKKPTWGCETKRTKTKWGQKEKKNEDKRFRFSKTEDNKEKIEKKDRDSGIQKLVGERMLHNYDIYSYTQNRKTRVKLK